MKIDTVVKIARENSRFKNMQLTHKANLKNGRYAGKHYGRTVEIADRKFTVGVHSSKERGSAPQEKFVLLDDKLFKVVSPNVTKTAQAASIIIRKIKSVNGVPVKSKTIEADLTDGGEGKGEAEEDKKEDADEDKKEDADEEEQDNDHLTELPDGGGMIKEVPMEIVDPDKGCACHELEAEIADEPETRARGVSGRDELPCGKGMFFDTPGPFWMKDTKIPLDIIFVDKKGSIVDVQTMQPYLGAPTWLLPRYESENKAAAMALEVPSGVCKKTGIKPGFVLRVKKQGA